MTSITDQIRSHKLIAAAALITLTAIVIVVFFIIGKDPKVDSVAAESYTKEKKAMTENVNGLLDCMSEGDYEGATAFCNKKSAITLGLSSMDADAFRSALLEEIGINEESVYKPTSDALDNMITTASAEFVRKSDVSMVKNITKGKDGKITGQIELEVEGISDFNSLSFADAVTAANEDLVTYINSDMDNLMNNLESQGRDNLKTALVNHSMVKLFNDMTEGLSSIPSTKKNYLLTISVSEDKKGNLSSKIENVSLLD